MVGTLLVGLALIGTTTGWVHLGHSGHTASAATAASQPAVASTATGPRAAASPTPTPPEDQFPAARMANVAGRSSPPPAIVAGPVTASQCPGAHLPGGYSVDHGRPHLWHVPYTPAWRYNPQSISGFVLASADDSADTTAQRNCLVRIGISALLAGAQPQTVTGFDDTPATALWFPYPFSFQANPDTPAFAPGWHSALGQGTALRALMVAAKSTGNTGYVGYGEEVLNSFAVPMEQGGVVSYDDGILWFQEYPTAPPSYVLNGNQETLISVEEWAAYTGSSAAEALVDGVLASEKAILPLYEVDGPAGTLESYDLLRGRSDPDPWRVSTTRGAQVLSAAVRADADGDGVGGSALQIPVSSPNQPGPNLLRNGSLSDWSGGRPVDWSVRLAEGRAGMARDAGGLFAAMTVSASGARPGLGQLIPAARLVPGATYRLTFDGKESIPARQVGTSGSYVLNAQCPSGTVALRSEGTIRGYDWSTFNVAVTMPSTRCALLVGFYPTGHTPGTTVQIRNVSLRRVQARPSAGVPDLPLRVLASPHPTIQLSYVGSGTVQVWREGRWVDVATLPATSTPSTVTVPVPAWAQGRTVNWGYDEIHVTELYVLGTELHDADLLAVARKWAPMAPSRHYLPL